MRQAPSEVPPKKGECAENMRAFIINFKMYIFLKGHRPQDLEPPNVNIHGNVCLLVSHPKTYLFNVKCRKTTV